MSESIIQCPICDAYNIESDVFCANCGGYLDGSDDETFEDFSFETKQDKNK